MNSFFKLNARPQFLFNFISLALLFFIAIEIHTIRINNENLLIIKSDTQLPSDLKDVATKAHDDLSAKNIEDNAVVPIKIISPKDGDLFCTSETVPIIWEGPANIKSQMVSAGVGMDIHGGGLYIASLPGARDATSSTAVYQFNWDGKSLYSNDVKSSNILQIGISGVSADGVQFNEVMDGSFWYNDCE